MVPRRNAGMRDGSMRRVVAAQRRKSALLLAAPALLVVFLPLASQSADAAKHIDRQWFRQALAEETAHWRAAALRPNGFFSILTAERASHHRSASGPE